GIDETQLTFSSAARGSVFGNSAFRAVDCLAAPAAHGTGIAGRRWRGTSGARGECGRDRDPPVDCADTRVPFGPGAVDDVIGDQVEDDVQDGVERAARQGGADATVGSGAERDVAVVGTVDVETVGVGEDPW